MTLAFVKLYQIFIVRGPKNQKIQQLVIVHQAHWNSRFGEVFQGEHLALFEPGQVLPPAADPMAIGDVKGCANCRDSNVWYEFKNKFLVLGGNGIFEGFLIGIICDFSLEKICSVPRLNREQFSGFGLLESQSKKLFPKIPKVQEIRKWDQESQTNGISYVLALLGLIKTYHLTYSRWLAYMLLRIFILTCDWIKGSAPKVAHNWPLTVTEPQNLSTLWIDHRRISYTQNLFNLKPFPTLKFWGTLNFSDHKNDSKTTFFQPFAALKFSNI